MPKFFVDSKSIKSGKIFMNIEDSKHIRDVLRMKLLDSLKVSDEFGMDYDCVIDSFDDKKVVLKILDVCQSFIESPLNITLIQSVPKGDKMEYIIQKNTELGVSSFIPLITNRVVVKLDDKGMAKKQERWQKISKEASKQSNRSKIPVVEKVENIKNIVKVFDKYDLVLLLYECEKKETFRNIVSKFKNVKNVAVIVGPEGGFDEDEVKYLIDNGAKVVGLGPRIFRTETAGIVVNTMLMYEYGDIG